MNTQNDTIQTIVQGVSDALYDPSTASLPAPEMVTFYNMRSKRKYWLDFEVGMSVVELIKQIVAWNEEDRGIEPNSRKPIWLYLFNYGGDADLCWALIDTIIASRTPVYTVDVGQCASSAALIFMAGHRRFMMPMSTILIHEGSVQLGGDATKVQDNYESYYKMLKHMHDYILTRTNIPPELLTDKKSNDWELNASECYEYGVTDQIIASLDDII